MERKIPTADEAKHAFYGVQVADNFTVHSRGDTLMNRGVEYVLDHYPNGITGDENDGFGGELDKDFHTAMEYTSYREAVKDARNNYCAECEENSN